MKITNQKLINLIFLLFLLITLSCSSDDDNENDELKAAQKDCELAIANAQAQSSVACCVLGNFKGSPGETLTYSYNTNLDNLTISWSVVSGDIAIINGQDLSTVTIILGDFFNGGEIVCFAKASNGSTCSDAFTITKK